MSEVMTIIEKLGSELMGGVPVLVGGPTCENEKIYNAYYLIKDGKHSIVSRKHHLPNKNVFDEKRVFSSGPISEPFEISGIKIGSPICEDLWFQDVSNLMVGAGADFLISPNGSPYSRNKIDTRHKLVAKRTKETSVPIVYLN